MKRRRQRGEGSTLRLDLSAGASLALIFKGSLFDLTQEERELIATISSAIQRYKDAEAPPLEQGAQA